MTKPTRADLRYWTGEKFEVGNDPIIASLSPEQFDRIAQDEGYVKVTDECPNEHGQSTGACKPHIGNGVDCGGSGRVLREGVVPVFRQGGLSEAFYRDDTDDPDGYLIPASMLEAADE